VETLKSKGFKKAAALLGGYQLWAQEGRAVEKTKK
jgi:rhodanese-related sulfurtransferase